MLGSQIQQRRQAMTMSLNTLSRQMGGSPGPSFLSRIEAGQIEPSPTVTERLASALDVPADILMNAAGYATDEQRAAALNALQEYMAGPTRVVQSVPVMDARRPAKVGQTSRQRIVPPGAHYIMIDLEGPENAPYIGEALVDVDRGPQPGQGVVVLIDDVASAWTFRDAGGKVGVFIENGKGERRTKWDRLVGVIVRVVQEMDLV